MDVSSIASSMSIYNSLQSGNTVNTRITHSSHGSTRSGHGGINMFKYKSDGLNNIANQIDFNAIEKDTKKRGSIDLGIIEDQSNSNSNSKKTSIASANDPALKENRHRSSVNEPNGNNRNIKPSNNICVAFFQAWRIAINDRVFLLVCGINFFRFVGVATFLNEYPFISEEFYGFNSTLTGFMLGLGASCLIAGSILSMKIGKSVRNKIQNMNNITSNTNSDRNNNLCVKIFRSKSIELDILRFGCLIGLISCLVFNLLPIFVVNTFHIKNVHKEVTGDDCDTGWNYDNFQSYWECYIAAMDHSIWYFTLIPFCIYTCAAGMINPPATVVLLEPYPQISGVMAGISTVWTYAMSYTFVIILTQILSAKMSQQPFILHFILGICGFMIFFIAWVLLSKTQVEKRMNKGNL